MNIINSVSEGMPDNWAEITNALIVVLSAIFGIFKSYKMGRKDGSKHPN